jgi:hypothetical protein
MHDMFALLAGGDRRSIGDVNTVLAAVENGPSFFEVALVKMHLSARGLHPQWSTAKPSKPYRHGR